MNINNYEFHVIDKHDNEWDVIETSDVETILEELEQKNAELKAENEKKKKIIDMIKEFVSTGQGERYISGKQLFKHIKDMEKNK